MNRLTFAGRARNSVSLTSVISQIHIPYVPAFRRRATLDQYARNLRRVISVIPTRSRRRLILDSETSAEGTSIHTLNLGSYEEIIFDFLCLEPCAHTCCGNTVAGIRIPDRSI
jgi:hypothetical protein